jgi:hypothetical protein
VGNETRKDAVVCYSDLFITSWKLTGVHNINDRI